MLHRRNVRHGQGWRVGNRSYEARKRHENHGDCGSPWIAALGQHARGEPSRSAFGAAMFRLLHDRGQAGKFDRRSRRSAGCGAAKGRHRDDRAASMQPKQAGHARSPKVKPLHATLARRALLRLDSMAAPDPHSLGVPRPQFPRLCPACLPRYSVQTILRRVLAITRSPRLDATGHSILARTTSAVPREGYWSPRGWGIFLGLKIDQRSGSMTAPSERHGPARPPSPDVEVAADTAVFAASAEGAVTEGHGHASRCAPRPSLQKRHGGEADGRRVVP